MHAISTLLETFILRYGILAVFFAMLLESCCIPLPSELIMTYAGYEVFRGNIALIPVIIAGIVGNVIGSMIAYYIGERGGRPLLRRYGKYILFSEKHFAASEAFFSKYGAFAVLVGRVLPAVRTFISLPAGIGKMNKTRFIVYTTLGCIPWVALLTYIGYVLGQHWDTVNAHASSVSIVLGLLIVVAVIWFFVRNRQPSRTR